MPTRRDLVALTAASAAMSARSAASAPRSTTRSTSGVHGLTSPDGRLEAILDASGATPKWSVAFDGRPLLLPSELGLWLASGRLLGDGAKVAGVSFEDFTGAWTPPFGQSSRYDQSGRQIRLHFVDAKASVRFDVILRVLNGAAAVRYELIATPNGKSLTLAGERTRYRFPETARLYASRDEGDIHVSAQADLAPLEHPDLTGSSDKGPFADLPVTVDVGNGVFGVMAESDRLHYPRCMVRAHEKGGLVTCLMRYPGRATGWGGPGDTPQEATFDIEVGQKTPWRVLLAADSAKGLIERHHVVPTLATPNQLGDVSWVKPGQPSGS